MVGAVRRDVAAAVLDVTPLRLVVLYRQAVPEGLARTYATSSSDPALFTLARALAAGAPATAGLAIMVARPDPPLLAAIGRFGPEDEARLQALHTRLRTHLGHTVYLDHRGAEAACERLAGTLTARFGREELARMRFVGVPRGGLIVLGMLAYALDLHRSQLGFGPADAGDAADPDGPLVVVDDCVISGLRLAQFLAGRHERQIVVATLYSHPDLRRAIRGREPRVVEVVSAHDLRDHARDIRGDDYDAWHARWTARSDGRAFWLGEPEHVCFPWGEPESGVWNPVTCREEVGWRLIPPELSLKARHTAAANGWTARLQESATGRHRVPAHVVYGDLDGEVVLGHLETMETFTLSGIAADLWRAAVSCGDDETAAARVAGAVGADPAEVLADLREFLNELRAAGLLEEAGT